MLNLKNKHRIIILFFICFSVFLIDYIFLIKDNIIKKIQGIGLQKEQSEEITKQLQQEIKPNQMIQKKFDKIFKNKLWGPGGDGSGPGSTIEFTDNLRTIIYNLVKKYKINSILDAPCGAMAWMPLLLRQLGNEIENFQYHGVDVVETMIDSLKIKFKNESNWKFSLNDITKQQLPIYYELFKCLI